MIEIVELGTADIPWIRELMYESWMKVYPSMVSTGAAGVTEIFDEWMSESVVEKDMSSGLRFYSVDDGGVHVCIFALEDLGDGVMLVGKLYVRAGYERKGYGSIAMRFAQECACREGIRCMRLFANSKNINAIAFYERFGFIRVACDHRVAGNDAQWDELTMEKTL